MEQVLKLSQKNLDLSKAEAIALLNPDRSKSFDDLLIIGPSKIPDQSKRLALTHSIYEFLFKCNQEDLDGEIRRFNWQRFKGSFSVRADGNEAKAIANKIYARFTDPKVNLSHPDNRFVFFKRGSTVIACRHISDTDKSYQKRKAHLRPMLHPTSMDPGLAKACINITGLAKGKILDPFCGSGGILIEAGLMGFEVEGYDIDPKQVERGRVNMLHFGIKPNIYCRDALQLDAKGDAIVTDFPYGKSSKTSAVPIQESPKKKDHASLYQDFLSRASHFTGRMVVIFPDFSDPDTIVNKFLKSSSWKINGRFEIYVHRSLSRIIFSLQKK